MTPQEEMDKYGNVIVCTQTPYKPGDVEYVHDRPFDNSPIGQVVIVREATREEINERGKQVDMIWRKVFKYFYIAKAE